MNILITGIHGFIGSNFIRALRDKHTLYGLDIIFPCRDGVIQTFSWRDIEPTSFPFQILPKFDAVIHLAGKALIRRISQSLNPILTSIPA